MMFGRFVWAVEDRTLQELSSQYTGGLDCQDSRISATLDTSLQSSKVDLNTIICSSAISTQHLGWQQLLPPQHDCPQIYFTKRKFASFWLLLRCTTFRTHYITSTLQLLVSYVNGFNPRGDSEVEPRGDSPIRRTGVLFEKFGINP